MFDALIDTISDLATAASEGAVNYIAVHSNLKKDGKILFLLKFIVACLVYLTLLLVIPGAVLIIFVYIVLPVFFKGL